MVTGQVVLQFSLKKSIFAPFLEGSSTLGTEGFQKVSHWDPQSVHFLQLLAFSPNHLPKHLARKRTNPKGQLLIHYFLI